MTSEEHDQWLERERARDCRAYAVSYAVVCVLRRVLFTLPTFEVLRHTTELHWAIILGIALVASYPLQWIFRWWLNR